MRPTAARGCGCAGATSTRADGRADGRRKLMDGGGLLATIGLTRQLRPRGFCPACRVLLAAREAGQELAKPVIAAAVVLAVAALAWDAMVHHARAMASMAGM